MRDDYKNQMASKIAGRYQDLELRIMKDIVRRIKKTGKITSTADWQINRLLILGYSSEDIEKEIKKTLDASYPEMFELYDKVIDWEYVRNKDIYEQINVEHIPFDQNEQLKQITDAIIDQSFADLENITNSLGFYLDYGDGKKVITPLAQVYTNYLDSACFDIVTGAFDYNSVLRRVVTQLTNSGLRQIDYSSGRANRVDVAARKAVMTAVSQITGKISEYNAKKLGTEYFEVEWHAGARPTHSVWQGRVWKEEQLYSSLKTAQELALVDRAEMPGLETAARDLLEMHPEHMEPEHILMNSWKKLQVHEPRSLKELHWRTSSGVRA